MQLYPVSIRSSDDWADAILSLPVSGLLPQRTVVVPNERVAYTLRRALMARGKAAALVGTGFCTLLELARGVLANAGEHAQQSSTEGDPQRVREALAHVSLERFRSGELLALPGWDRAFAHTIRELEAAGVGARALLASEDAQVRDVGRLFALVADPTKRLAAGTLLYRAATRLAACGALHAQPTLVVWNGFESAAELAFARALPNLHCAVIALRPARTEQLAQLSALHGPAITALFAAPSRASATRSRLAQLQANLFAGEAPSAPEDGSVRVVTYAGVHEEVEAAVGWVVEQLVEHGSAAQDIALLSPTPDAYAPLLRDRLRALPCFEAELPVYVERGLPLTERADGARLLQLVRALREGLPREQLAPLFLTLKASCPEHKLHGLSDAWRLLNAIGCVGGDPAHLAQGLSWLEAWSRALARHQTTQHLGGGLPEQEAREHTQRAHELTVYLDTMRALTSLLRIALDDAPLRTLWAALEQFVAQFVRLPPASPPALALLDEAVASFSAECDEPTGVAALAWLEDALCNRRVSSSRFGVPAIYVGSLAGARGLSFRAVRVLGLAEGCLPSAVREDPVLSDVARAALSAHLPTSRSRSLSQLACFSQVVHATRERLVLSAPKVSHEGSVRQPAAVLLDVMRALGSPASELEESFERAAGDARKHERRQRDLLAISLSAQLSRAAAGERAEAPLPNVISLAALRAVAASKQQNDEYGLLPNLVPAERLAGLSAARPMSATRLGPLLSCPHRFLLENVLYWREAQGPLPAHTMDARSFGVLLHQIAERFWRSHGEDFGRRTNDLAHYQALMRALAHESFPPFRDAYPFASEGTARAQLDALCDQLEKLLEYDWLEGSPRTYVAVERTFGFDQTCTLTTAAGAFHVRGSIDRLDLEDDALLLRDLKTGKSRPRGANAAPEPGYDLQLGLYARVAEELAASWNTPKKVGVSYVYLRSGEPERRWSGADYRTLRKATDEWLATAVEVLSTGSFARTPLPKDCRFCAHQPTCTTSTEERSAVLEQRRASKRLRKLKLETP